MKITSFEMWRPVAIINKTTRTLSNGKVIKTWTAMTREAAKI